MHSPDDLLAGYRRFRAGTHKQRSDLYRDLGEGQAPSTMVIACADSRVEPAEIFSTGPGELFVVRNVANLVPSFEASDRLHSVAAAVEFAVVHLQVKHIVVMGHASCGGVGASLSAAQGKPIGQFIAPWVELLEMPRDKVLAGGSDDAQTRLEHAGIEQSLSNLMSFPFVKDAVASGALELHGSWFAIGDGELHWRDSASGEFLVVDPA